MTVTEYMQQREHILRDAVEQSAATLDRHFPGWEDKIDLDTLDISNVNQCVLGQLFQEEARKDHDRWIANGYDYAMERHYSLLFGMYGEAFASPGTTRYWKELIQARRDVAAMLEPAPAKKDHALTA